MTSPLATQLTDAATPLQAGAIGTWLAHWLAVGKDIPAAVLRQDPSCTLELGERRALASIFLAKQYAGPLALVLDAITRGVIGSEDDVRQRLMAFTPALQTATLHWVTQHHPTTIPPTQFPFPAITQSMLGGELWLRLLTGIVGDVLAEQSTPSAPAPEPFWHTAAHPYPATPPGWTGSQWEQYVATIRTDTVVGGLRELTVPAEHGSLVAMDWAISYAHRHRCPRIVLATTFLDRAAQLETNLRTQWGLQADDPRVIGDFSGSIDIPADTELAAFAADQRWSLMQRWNGPYTITSTAQLFDSLHSNQVRRCRKLHHLIGSVLVLDTTHLLPMMFRRPILTMLQQLSDDYGVTVLLSGTTPLSVDHLLPHRSALAIAVPDTAAPAPPTVQWELDGPLATAALVERMEQHDQVLIITNTKGDAGRVLDAATATPGVLYLSSEKCRAHRAATLAEIRQRLASGRLCRVITTSLGDLLDLTFPQVFRALAPWEHLQHASAQCRPDGTLVVYLPVLDRHPSATYRRATSQTALLAASGQRDLRSSLISTRYSRALTMISNHDSLDILALRTNWNFPQVAARFHLVQTPTRTVLTPYVVPGQAPVEDVLGGFYDRELTLWQFFRVISDLTVSVPLKSPLAQPRLSHPIAPRLAQWDGRYDQQRGLEDALPPEDELTI